MNLGSWLRKTPHPHTIDVDGKKVQVPNGGSKWRDLVRTIETMKGSQITALDSAGNVIRALTIDEDSDDDKAPKGDSDVQVFARLIAEAYEKGTKSYAPLLDSAMGFIEKQGQRLAKAEAEIDRLRVHNARLRVEAAEASVQPESEGGMIEALATGLMQAHAGQSAAEVTPIKQGAKK
jgi:hypothetical protein